MQISEGNVFLVLSKKRTIFGHDALLGLKVMELFDITIKTLNGVKIFYRDKLIGREAQASNHSTGSFRILKKVSPHVKPLNSILDDFADVFSELDDRPITGPPMRIITTHQRPIHAKQRRYAPNEIAVMKEHINSLLKKNIIEPANSDYAANARIIGKKNGTGRLVINYIPLNAVTHRDSFSLHYYCTARR